MMNLKRFDALTDELSDTDFFRISHYVGQTYGIHLPVSKKSLVQSRLKKRLRILQIPSFQRYCDFLFSENGQEERTIQVIDAISTNKSEFFRESIHFDFLFQQLLPLLSQQQRGSPLKLLSAGCATGEEVYSLAMTVAEFFRLKHTNHPFLVVGADISTLVLEHARKGVYPFSKSNEIPPPLLKQYVMKSKNPEKQRIRIIPEIRRKTMFFRLNLMDQEFDLENDFDVIFCRNTLIYFEKVNQEAIVRKLTRHLKKTGYLFVGHSESLIHMDIELHQIKPTIYQKP